MQLLVNITLCASYLFLTLRRRSHFIDSDEWLGVFRPVVCLLVLMLYLFASLHKLNTGYFSEHSYALRLYRDIVYGEHMSAFAHLFPTDDAFLALLAPLSVLTELAIPVLLCFRRTRLVAILIGMSFHTLLSLKEYPPGTDFPSLLGAAYILFLPNPSIDIINTSILDRLRSSKFFQPLKSLIALALLLAIIFVPALYSLARHSTVDWFSFANLKSTHWAAHVLTYFALLFVLIYKLRRKDYDNTPAILRSVQYPLFSIIVVAFLVGMSPYLGLRTAGTFAMFSNLITQGNYSNHFFMPQELQIFDYQKQVCVIETTAKDIPTTAKTASVDLLHVSPIGAQKPASCYYLYI